MYCWHLDQGKCSSTVGVSSLWCVDQILPTKRSNLVCKGLIWHGGLIARVPNCSVILPSAVEPCAYTCCRRVGEINGKDKCRQLATSRGQRLVAHSWGWAAKGSPCQQKVADPCPRMMHNASTSEKGVSNTGRWV